MEVRVRSKHTENGGSEPKKRQTSVVFSKKVDLTQAEGKYVTSLKRIAKGGLLHGVSAIPVKSIEQKIVKNIVKKCRLAGVTERLLKEREKKCPTLGIMKQGGQGSRNPNAVSCEQLGSCAIFIEANMEFVQTKKTWDLHKNIYIYKSKKTYVQACEKFFQPPTRKLKRKLSHLVRCRT